MTAAPDQDRSSFKARLRPAVGPALSFGDQILSSICNFLTTLLLARALGLEAFGLYTTVWLALYLAMSLQLGLIVSPMMSIGSQEDEAEAQAYYTVVFVHQAAYVAVAALVIFAVLTFAAAATALDGAALPGAATAAAYLTQDFLRRYLFARRRPAAVLLIDVVNQALKLGTLAILWHAGPIGVAHALWAVAAAAAVSAACGLIVSGPFVWKPAVFPAVTRRQWRSARWLVLTGSVQWMLSYSGLLVTAGLFGPRILGALRVAQSLLAVMNVVREALENVVPPLAGAAFATAGLPGLRRVLGRAIGFALLIGVSATLGLVLFGQRLLHLLYGSEILEFDWVIAWYSLIFPMALVNLVLGCAFRALERTRPLFLTSLSAACFNLLAVYPAALIFGVAGLISVTLLTELITLIVLTVLIARTSGLLSGRGARQGGRSAGGEAAVVPAP
ncbi:sugar transporter [Bosea sp. (in: a-proteobacteria)]|uniref:sugar transporter n=1 Tax=Bosea sp. (in: a-proteobacteria) TaxID=1871050 RepID=UPI002629D169|nr:sugar transporter [Bosea sp. (in: a-proteobacteria)]MCO5090981.1 sugar transporter [Bosea sp. (in: a-proteobacteria)]